MVCGRRNEKRCLLTWDDECFLRPHRSHEAGHRVSGSPPRPATLSAAFDDHDLIAHAGLIPTIRPAERCGLLALVAEGVPCFPAYERPAVLLMSISNFGSARSSEKGEVARVEVVGIQRPTWQVATLLPRPGLR
ncbi:hypothetical protein GCM10010230_24710 [Streptomyces narbonensis]|nr:hypothetical protein GCM10010230_24710 [Streptomyces narbonensis]